MLERRSGVAQEASFANAGVMAPGYVGPWAAPGMPRKVLSYLLRPEAPVVFRPSLESRAVALDPRAGCASATSSATAATATRMQRLAFYSQSELRALRTLHALDYEQATGYLQLFRTEKEVEASVDDARDARPNSVCGTRCWTRHSAARSSRRCIRPRRWPAACICRTTRPATARTSRIS